jgi:hypothetical protein
MIVSVLAKKSLSQREKGLHISYTWQSDIPSSLALTEDEDDEVIC